jgi:hypothetical protein
MGVQIDNNAIQAIFMSPRYDGKFEGQLLEYAQALSKSRKMLVLPFAPKVGGTFFTQSAIYALGGQLIRTLHAGGGRDGTFYLPTVMLAFLDTDAPHPVTHIHMQALVSNRNFIEAFDLRPVIMVRSIPDSLASFWDMMEATEYMRVEGFQSVVPKDFLKLSKEAKESFLVDMFAYWFVSYYASWMAYLEVASDRICVLRYTDLKANPASTLERALTHAGFSVTPEQCAEGVERATDQKTLLRFNKGIVGRGRKYFSDVHLQKIASMMKHYPQLKPWADELMGV